MKTKTQLDHLVTSVMRGVAVQTPKRSDAETTAVINIKDIAEGRIDTTSLERRVITSARHGEDERIQEGDLIVALRGSQFKAGVADKQASGHFITSNLVALRLDLNKVIPEVLAAYLNSPEGQYILMARSKGTTVPSINQKELLSIEVPLLSMENQQHIRDYLHSTDEYLATLRAEEEIVRKIRDYAIFRSFEVRA
ncbi:MAG: restriction endonuclease subunit S [Candidatus Methanomethylophilaceae archaeon]